MWNKKKLELKLWGLLKASLKTFTCWNKKTTNDGCNLKHTPINCKQDVYVEENLSLTGKVSISFQVCVKGNKKVYNRCVLISLKR